MSDTPNYTSFFSSVHYTEIYIKNRLKNLATQCFQVKNLKIKIRDIPKVSREGKPPQNRLVLALICPSFNEIKNRPMVRSLCSVLTDLRRMGACNQGKGVLGANYISSRALRPLCSYISKSLFFFFGGSSS
jgi:hypothetical protein